MVLRVRGILMDEEGHLLLVQNKGMAYYSLPGGHAEKGESTEESFRREIQEELGLDVDEVHLRFIVEMPHINSFECYYVTKISKVDVVELRGVDFEDEIDDVTLSDYRTTSNYFPMWLKDYAIDEIFKETVSYLGVKK